MAIPYLIADHVPALRKYKVDDRHENTAADHWRVFKGLMVSHIFIQGPMIALTHPFLEFLGMRMDLPLPPVLSVIKTIAICFVVEDLFFYIVHRILHWPYFYKWIHKVHHEHSSDVFSIVAEWAHPLETAILGLGTILGPIVSRCDHVATLWAWLFFRLLQTVDTHSGYVFPWSPSNWIPFVAGPDCHWVHHATFNTQFASTFTLWDKVFGTDKTFRRRILKEIGQDNAPSSKKNASPDSDSDSDSSSPSLDSPVAQSPVKSTKSTARASTPTRRSPRLAKRKPKLQ